MLHAGVSNSWLKWVPVAGNTLLFVSTGIVYQAFLPPQSYMGEAYPLPLTRPAAKFMWGVSHGLFPFLLLAETLALCATGFSNIPRFPEQNSHGKGGMGCWMSEGQQIGPSFTLLLVLGKLNVRRRGKPTVCWPVPTEARPVAGGKQLLPFPQTKG